MNPAMESSSDGGEESKSDEHPGDSPDKTPEESSPQRSKESGRQLEQETDMAIGGYSFRGHGFRWGVAGKRSEKSPEVEVVVESLGRECICWWKIQARSSYVCLFEYKYAMPGSIFFFSQLQFLL